MLKASEFQPQEAANIVWAYAVLQLYSDELFEVLAQRGVHHADCEPRHLANIAWACAEVSYTWSPLVDMASAAMAKLEEFGSKELGNILWSLSRLGGPRAAWPLFTAADRKRLDVGKSGVSAMLSNSERHKIPSRRSLADELRLLMRSRGDVRPFFVAAAAARAAEAGLLIPPYHGEIHQVWQGCVGFKRSLCRQEGSNCEKL